MPIQLNELKPNETAIIIGFHGGDREYRHRLLSLGLTQKTPLRLVRIAPLGDPIEIEVRGFLLCLRKEEARILILEKEVGL